MAHNCIHGQRRYDAATGQSQVSHAVQPHRILKDTALLIFWLQYSRLSDIYGRKSLLLASYCLFAVGILLW